jgi:hypothetical protein
MLTRARTWKQMRASNMLGSVVLISYLCSPAAADPSSVPPLPQAPAPTDSTASFTLAGTAWDSVARKHGISPYLLYAVALKESARYHRNKHSVTPWPWALHGPDGAAYPETEDHARELLAAKLERTPLVDVGLLQINVRWHGHRVESPDALLDPLTNLYVGAAILAETIRSAPEDLALGVGRYHHWRNEDIARGYGEHVLAIYRRLLELTEYGR